jgi:hypothetical protein
MDSILDSRVQSQIELEKLVNKNQLLKRLRNEFNCPEIVQLCADNNYPINFAVDLLSQIYLHKRAKIQVLVGLLYKHIGKSNEDLQTCADLILRAAEIDLIDFSELTQQFIIKIDISDDVKDELSMYQYPLPLLVEPKPITNNNQSGYYTSNGSVMLNNTFVSNPDEKDYCLDHLNRLNKTKLTINADTVRHVQNTFDSLKAKKDGETKEEYAQRLSVFEKFKTTTDDVINSIYLRNENSLWFTHKFDKRGRTYCMGHHLTYQGYAFQKSIIEFFDKEVIPLD